MLFCQQNLFYAQILSKKSNNKRINYKTMHQARKFGKIDKINKIKSKV